MGVVLVVDSIPAVAKIVFVSCFVVTRMSRVGVYKPKPKEPIA